MSSVLPFDIIDQIIDIVGENKDIDLLKDLALVSHSFLQICTKHLFATVELHGADSGGVPRRRVASSKKGFVKLLKSRPDVVKYIQKLTYKVEGTKWEYDGPCPQILSYPSFEYFDNDDHLLSPILANLLRTIPRLNCLTITSSNLCWTSLDCSLKSAFLHLMHLPTINHIDLSHISDFPLSSHTLSVNLRRLDLSYMTLSDPLERDGSHEIVQSEMPKIREFRSLESSQLAMKLLYAKWQDGRSAFNFMDLRGLSMSFNWFQDERIIHYVLQNAKLLEKLHLSVGPGQSLVRLHDILSSSAHTLKVLGLTVPLCAFPLALAGLCEGLEAMAGRYILEALSFEVQVDGHESEDFIGSTIQEVENVLVKPGWSGLRKASFKVSIACCMVTRVKITDLFEALQSLPDKYLTRLSKLESVTIDYSAYSKCALYHGD